MKSISKVLVVAATVVLQCLAISYLIYRYERILKSGDEVSFKCRAYDPRDPLRGRYLRVSVEGSTTNVFMKEKIDVNRRHQYNDKFFVRIEPSTNGFWCVAEAALNPQREGIWIKPQSSHVEFCLSYNEKKDNENYGDFYNRQKKSGLKVRTSLPNQLFLNEKIAPEADKILMKEREKLVAKYKVYDGKIIITDILVDDKPIVELAKEKKKDDSKNNGSRK